MARFALATIVCLHFASPSLAADSFAEQAKLLADSAGKQWRSDVLEVKLADDTVGLRILVLEFAPAGKDRPDEVKVKLSLATPIEGNAGTSSSSIVSTGGFRDVRLEEKDGARTITITRSIDTVEKPNKNTQRVLDRSAITFEYELKGDSLTFKGFSKDKPTAWGQLGFTVPNTEITFKK